jgi:hypothetical protein
VVGATAKEVIAMAIDTQHRESGDISRKHGDTLIGTFRKTYGPSFAKQCADDEKLSEVLHKLDEPSLTQLIHDHDAGNIDVMP